MGMVVVIGRRHLASPVGVGRRGVVGVVVTVLVAVVTEMAGINITLPMFQRVTNAHNCSRGSVQRKQDGEQEGQEEAHGPDYIRQCWRQQTPCRQRRLFVIQKVISTRAPTSVAWRAAAAPPGWRRY